MTLIELIGTLLFLALAVTLVVAGGRALWQAARGRRAAALATCRRAAIAVAVYGAAVLAVSAVWPRHYRAPGERECFDDWCVAGQSAMRTAVPAAGCPSGTEGWLVTLRVSSQARRVRQRARDVTVFLEDGSGRRHGTCGGVIADAHHDMRDLLGPGESFEVSLPFALAHGARPAGVVVEHGRFPGLLVLGDDQAALHTPTLLRLATR